MVMMVTVVVVVVVVVVVLFSVVYVQGFVTCVLFWVRVQDKTWTRYNQLRIQKKET